jgi:hypothetical protein
MKLSTIDSAGKRGYDYHNGRDSIVGASFLHSEDHRVYMVDAIVWNSNTDTWYVLHSHSGTDVMFVRSIDNFLGDLNGSPRFIRIVEK